MGQACFVNRWLKAAFKKLNFKNLYPLKASDVL